MSDKLKPDEDITDLVRFVRSMIKTGAPDGTIASSLAAWNRRTHSERERLMERVVEAVGRADLDGWGINVCREITEHYTALREHDGRGKA